MLGAGSPFPSWSEELPVKATTESDASAQRDVDGPSSAQPERDSASEQEGPGPERRFTPFRPRSLTPEEHEEAERLKRLAAKYGTDPTAIVGRVQLSGQYTDLPQGVHASDSTLRVDLPFRSKWLLRVDAPFVKWTDPNRPAIGSATGASDIFTTLGWRLYNTPEHAFLIGAVSTFPTAGEQTLGSGEYTTGPFIATARFLPKWESFLFGIFQHQISVGGDPSRSDISLTRARAQISTIWAERWWTVAQAVWQVDWERSAKSSMTMEFEVGRSLMGRLGAFVRPGVGIWGRNISGAPMSGTSRSVSATCSSHSEAIVTSEFQNHGQ